MFRKAGVFLPGQNCLLPGVGTVTYFTDVLANWRADPTAKNNFSYKFTDADCIKGGGVPGKFMTGSVKGVLPAKGDIIEALWTEDGKVKGWFAAEVLLGDVSQRQAKKRSAASGI
jgi:hypothetical protein